MSYKLEKPYTDEKYANFVVEHNHNNGRKIEETETAVYALEAWELLQGDEVIDNTEAYEAEQAVKERNRLDMLSLTKADVLLALYEDKGLTPDDIKTMLADNVPALIKFDYASSYYRGDEVVNALGFALGYTTEEMDYLFENKAFPTVEETEEETPQEADTEQEEDTLETETSEDVIANETTTDDTRPVAEEIEEISGTDTTDTEEEEK